MARTRNLKPSFFRNELLAEMGPLAQLLFEGLWTLADRAGRLEDRPARIKGEVFPYYEAPVDQLLDGLANAKDPFIIRYEKNGKRYIQVINFKKHQNPHKQEQPSRIPSVYQVPNKLRSSSEVAGPLSLKPSTLTLKPSTLNLKPVSPDHKNEMVDRRRLQPRNEPEKPYAIPLPEEKPVDSLVLFYKVLQGAPYDFRPWDKAWGRWKIKAAELLGIFQGDYSVAYQCLKTKGEELTAANRTWNFNTIVDQAHLWRQQHGGEEHALINRERFLRDVIEQRRARKIEGLRKVSTPGEILHELRDSGHLSSKNGEKGQPENGDRNRSNGRALAAIQSRDLESEETRQVSPRQEAVDEPGPDYSATDEWEPGPDG